MLENKRRDLWTYTPLHNVWWLGVFSYLTYSIYTAKPGTILGSISGAISITVSCVACFALFLATRRMHFRHLREREQWQKEWERK